MSNESSPLSDAVAAAAQRPERSPLSGRLTEQPRRERLRREDTPPPSGNRRRVSHDAEPGGTAPGQPEQALGSEQAAEQLDRAPKQPGRELPRCRQGKKSLTGPFPAEVHKQLRLLALHADTTCQDLLQDAVADLLDKYETEPPSPQPSAEHEPYDGPTKKVTVWLDTDIKRQLGFLKLEHDLSLQSLLGQAIDDLFEKHRLPTIVPQSFRS